MVRRRFALALLLSAIFHFALVAGPAWHPPSEPAQEVTTLKARLAHPPAPRVVAPISPSAPKPTPKLRRLPHKAQSTVPQQPKAAAKAPVAAQTMRRPSAKRAARVVDDTAVPAVSPAAASAAADGFDVPLPGSGRMDFDVMLGDDGFVVGRSVATWHLDDRSYSIRNVAETTGLVSLFKRAKVTQTSAGEVSAGGLVPREYALMRDDSGRPSEAARFDWEAHKITLLRNGESVDAELLDGSYDILSLVYQLAWFPPQASALQIPVATGKSYLRQQFTVLGEERLSLRLGYFRTLHLRVGRAGDNITEVWLSLDYKNLPLRIRHTAKNGDIFEQQATEVRYGDVKLLAPPQ